MTQRPRRRPARFTQRSARDIDADPLAARQLELPLDGAKRPPELPSERRTTTGAGPSMGENRPRTGDGTYRVIGGKLHLVVPAPAPRKGDA